MFKIFGDAFNTATQGSKPRHQRLSHQEWEHRFIDEKRNRSLHAQRLDAVRKIL